MRKKEKKTAIERIKLNIKQEKIFIRLSYK